MAWFIAGSALGFIVGISLGVHSSAEVLREIRRDSYRRGVQEMRLKNSLSGADVQFPADLESPAKNKH